VRFTSFGASDIGLARVNNEDAFAQLPQEKCFLLADGMGGHKAGEVAANETVVWLCNWIKKATQNNPSPEEWSQVIAEGIQKVNEWVFELASQDIEKEGMGTTLCLALLTDATLLCAHVGDSRIYQIRKGRITQLTRDHSLKDELIAKGELDESLGRSFPYKNVITRAIGTQKEVQPDLQTIGVEKGDLYFLCSDGLTDPLSDEKILATIQSAPSLRKATEELILEAKKSDGDDNITLILIKILS